MFKSLEELRIQRELVKKHLDWLDKQIEQFENSTPACESNAKNDISGSSLNQESKDHEHLKRTNTSEFSTTETKAIANEEDETTLLLHETSNIKQAKFGCIMFFAFITLFFLFLLFILPYMIK